jgi:hypothetical protein
MSPELERINARLDEAFAQLSRPRKKRKGKCA